jgi:hypothetical protein
MQFTHISEQQKNYSVVQKLLEKDKSYENFMRRNDAVNEDILSACKSQSFKAMNYSQTLNTLRREPCLLPTSHLIKSI